MPGEGAVLQNPVNLFWFENVSVFICLHWSQCCTCVVCSSVQTWSARLPHNSEETSLIWKINKQSLHFLAVKQWWQLFMCSISLWCGTFCKLMAHPTCMVVFWWRQFLHNYRSRLPAPGLDLFFTWGFRCERLSACSLLICNWQSYFIENGKVTANWFYSDSDGETMNVPSIQSAI